MIQANLEQMEKIFFAYILKNPTYFNRVEPTNFQDPNVRFVYEKVRFDYLMSKSKLVATPKKIRELVRLEDPSSKIVDDTYLKALLSIDVKEYEQNSEDDWLRKRLQSWIVYNSIWNKHYEITEKIREMDPIDYANTEKMAPVIREMMHNATLFNFDNDDLGSRFSDPKAHYQDIQGNKIPTGWQSIDELLGGGWDKKTLNVLYGPPNSGKSLWLCNIAANAANNGKNVIYFTLEMSEAKIMKRIGAMRLGIPIGEYDTKSRNTKFMEQKLKELKKKNANFASDSNLFENPMGEIIVKEYPTGSATVADFDAFVKKVQEETGLKIDMVIVDYIAIMSATGARDSLYQKGKYNAEGLRAIGQKYDASVITATQIDKDSWNSPNVDMNAASESKAIPETADTIATIIRTPEMKRNNVYKLRFLKLRDAEFKYDTIHFELQPQYLSIIKDKAMEYEA